VANSDGSLQAQCSSTSDFTQHYNIYQQDGISVKFSSALNSGGTFANTGENPNGWGITVHNSNSVPILEFLQIICQSPITAVAGVSVPEFGSLYVAIALGAVIYFALSRQHAGKRPAQATTRA
jgi:hypothetical protein